MFKKAVLAAVAIFLSFPVMAEHFEPLRSNLETHYKNGNCSDFQKASIKSDCYSWVMNEGVLSFETFVRNNMQMNDAKYVSPQYSIGKFFDNRAHVLVSFYLESEAITYRCGTWILGDCRLVKSDNLSSI